MNQLESNIIRSFQLVKQDIQNLKVELDYLTKSQTILIEKINELQGPKEEEKVFVASKTGKKYHIKTCPFTNNIRKESLLTFNTEKETPKNLKPCQCTKS